MRIGELAKESLCDVETIRFYEREGLLVSPDREINGYRRYSEADAIRLAFIRHCRSLGISLPDIRILQQFQANPELPCEKINELIDAQISRIHQQLDSLHTLEKQLLALRETCLSAHQVSSCGIMRNLTLAADGESCSCHGAEHKDKS